MTPADRKTNFKEVNFGFTEEMAKKEANRCLECGCHDYFECKLISYANDYDVNPSRFAGEKHNRNQENANDLISRNTDKCVLCGLCVRVCEEVMGKSAIGLINRGFNTLVEPELSKPLKETACIACGQCVALCPTGALREKTAFTKSVPVKENSMESICTNCSNLCSVDYRYIGSTVTRALPVGNGIICKGGRFSVLNKQPEATDFEALLNSDSIVISGKVSTETAFVLKKYAEENDKKFFTTAKETDANYYAISKLNIPQYDGEWENTIVTPDYCENGTFFDKYGNKRVQNAIFKAESLADYVNGKLTTPYADLTAEAVKSVNATPTGSVTNEDVINASKLFIKK
jgi:formate hydrogenlyase subunit 6/NADH:ubiquinone oxidoreductase subunit I